MFKKSIEFFNIPFFIISIFTGKEGDGMSLQFIFGRAGSGKSAYAIQKAASCEAEGKRVLMLVPEQYSHQGEADFLKAKGYLHENFNVTSFARLAGKLIHASGNGRTPLDSAGKAMLVYKALLNCKKDLKFYRSGTEKPGCVSLFMDMISECKKGQVTPDELRTAAGETEEPLFAARLQDIALILDTYNKLLTEAECDSDDNLTIAASLSYTKEYFKNSAVFIDAFYRFTQNELSFIRTVLSCSTEVTVCLTLPEGEIPAASVFSGAVRSRDALLRMAEEAGTGVLPPIYMTEEPRFLSRELKGLERALSGERISYGENSVSDISLYIAGGKYEEVTYAASAIRRFVAETDAAYRDIAVVAGDYDSYADLIASVFPLYDIPVFADTRTDFLSHSIVLYLFSVFDLLTGITTKSVFSYMKSGFADISPDDAALLENHALASGIAYGDWLSDDRFLYKVTGVFAKEGEEETDTDFLSIKNRLLAPILKLKQQISASKSAGDRITALFDFLEAQNLSDKIQKRAAWFQEENLLRHAEEFIEVYNILTDTLQMMQTVLGDEPIGISALRSVLEAGLSQKSIGVIPTVYDQISFGDLNRSVIKNPRALFILGANDGTFPAVPSAGALLSDSEREFLNARGISVAPDTKRLISDAEFSVYAAATVPREKLFISYTVSEEDGTGMRPAMFVSKVRRTFPKLSAEHNLDKEEPSPLLTATSASAAYNYLLTHIHEQSKNPLIDQLSDMLSQMPEYAEKLSRAKEYAAFSNTAGTLSKEAVQCLYGDTLYGSVSRFERYAACPFSFFIEYGLRAKERKILKVEAPDIGSLLHEVVEKFALEIHHCGKSFGTVTQEEQTAITDALIDEMFGAMYIKNIYGAGRLDALKKRLKSLVSKSVWALCEHVASGEFVPSAFEVQFGADGELPPVTVPLPDGGQVILTGRIDRLDTFSENGNLYLKIIDYKSGTKGYSLADIFNGTTLQLAVYMIATLEGLEGKTDKKPGFGGMFYFHLDDPVHDGTPETEADRETVLKSFKMSGLVSDNPGVVHAMDTDANKWSAIIPVYVKADGSVSKAQSKTAGDKEIDKLKRHIKKTVAAIGKEIMCGNVDISPIRDKNFSPCSYCKYISVCGFDPDIHPCRRPKHFSSDEEIWDEME